MTMTAEVSLSGLPFDPETAIARARARIGKQLSAARLERYRWLLSRYPRRVAAILPVLRLIEEEWGVIDDEGMLYAAILLDCPPSHVQGVVTFYTHLHTAGTGTHCLDVCMTLSCAVRGAGALLAHLESRLGIKAGETTPDGAFTLRKVECLASCASAPMLQCGDDFHELLTPEKVDQLLETLRPQGKATSGAKPPAAAAKATPSAAQPAAASAPASAPASTASAAKPAAGTPATPAAAPAAKDQGHGGGKGKGKGKHGKDSKR